MNTNRSRFMVYTTKHMHHKIFMLSQKLGMLQGSRISISKISSDAVIDYFDLNNNKEWEEIRNKLNAVALVEMPIGKSLKKEKQNGK